LVAAALHLGLQLGVGDGRDCFDADAGLVREGLEERGLLGGRPAPAPGVDVDRARLGDRAVRDDQRPHGRERGALQERTTSPIDLDGLRHDPAPPYSSTSYYDISAAFSTARRAQAFRLTGSNAPQDRVSAPIRRRGPCAPQRRGNDGATEVTPKNHCSPHDRSSERRKGDAKTPV